jgi:hypothetical protein
MASVEQGFMPGGGPLAQVAGVNTPVQDWNHIRGMANQAKARHGLFKAWVGTLHRTTMPNGKLAELRVHALSSLPEGAKTVARCLTCGKDYKTERELVSAHPSPAVMKKNAQGHCWAFWSTDAREPPEEVAGKGLIDQNGKALVADPAATGTIWGLLSDDVNEPAEGG